MSSSLKTLRLLQRIVTIYINIHNEHNVNDAPRFVHCRFETVHNLESPEPTLFNVLLSLNSRRTLGEKNEQGLYKANSSMSSCFWLGLLPQTEVKSISGGRWGVVFEICFIWDAIVYQVQIPSRHLVKGEWSGLEIENVVSLKDGN